jgi:hypothetical protein
MRRLQLSAVVVLAVLTAGSAALWAVTTASFTPGNQPGSIYTVIDFDRAQGRNQPTYVTIDWGQVHRKIIATPYGRSCRTATPSGFVLKLRPTAGGGDTLNLSTTGKIIRAPYSGEPPLELLSACYRLK